LKVTYLPEGFIASKRRAVGERPELTVLRRRARASNVPMNTAMSGGAQLEDLWQKLSDIANPEVAQVTDGLKAFRLKIVEEIEKDPAELITWLYENQGVRRFDASNRFFIVLVNTKNFFDSWKMKRALPALRDATQKYLDQKKRVGMELAFQWEGAQYRVISDALIVRN
jgi:hypothetical protein